MRVRVIKWEVTFFLKPEEVVEAGWKSLSGLSARRCLHIFISQYFKEFFSKDSRGVWSVWIPEEGFYQIWIEAVAEVWYLSQQWLDQARKHLGRLLGPWEKVDTTICSVKTLRHIRIDLEGTCHNQYPPLRKWPSRDFSPGAGFFPSEIQIHPVRACQGKLL